MAVAAPASAAPACGARDLLDIVERSLHANPAEWLFFRELRVGTGRRNGSAQRVDAFALNTLPHTAMKRICYEVKVSRPDFLAELKQPLKRRVGMRYSNEFYFVTPAGLVGASEIPAECGLVEAGRASPEQWRTLQPRQAGFFHYDAASLSYCIITIPAPWRDTPGPSWQLLAAMVRNQRWALEERSPSGVVQGRLGF
ncbi:MAG TPA: hypothetical protein VFL57_18790 [Bryobacteraceae bacterium]|nr:hypothetical protein [Bryobacteraceae bacterium]